MRRIPLGLTIATLMLDIGTEWTASRPLPKSSRLCASSRFPPDLCARTASRLRIEDAIKCSRIAHGFGFASGTEFAADLKLGGISFEQN
jgi:hypothetical protein